MNEKDFMIDASEAAATLTDIPFQAEATVACGICQAIINNGGGPCPLHGTTKELESFFEFDEVK